MKLRQSRNEGPVFVNRSGGRPGTGQGRELFDKCREFRRFTHGLRRDGIFESQYRLTLEGPLDHVIRVHDPFTGRVREMLCFDSNSDLGLHLDPRVMGAWLAAGEVARACV